MAEKAKTGTATAAPQQVPKVFPPLDASTFVPQLVWLAITFGFLYLTLSKVLLPRVGEVISERADRIKRDLAEAERLKAETEKALKSYEDALGSAKVKAGGIAKETRDRLSAETDRERAQVDQQMAAKLADAEKRIAETKKRAMTSVSDIATETATAIVAKLTGATVAADAVKKVVAATGQKVG
jgi:F-type H+-transporting ATPase subunit b